MPRLALLAHRSSQLLTYSPCSTKVLVRPPTFSAMSLRCAVLASLLVVAVCLIFAGYPAKVDMARYVDETAVLGT